MLWAITVKKKVQKQTTKLPVEIRKILIRLLTEIEIYGPNRSNWQTYGPLRKSRYHCHLKKGKPTYVAVWEIIDKEI